MHAAIWYWDGTVVEVVDEVVGAVVVVEDVVLVVVVVEVVIVVEDVVVVVELLVVVVVSSPDGIETVPDITREYPAAITSINAIMTAMKAPMTMTSFGLWCFTPVGFAAFFLPSFFPASLLILKHYISDWMF